MALMEKAYLIWIFMVTIGMTRAGSTSDRTNLHSTLLTNYDVTVYPNTDYSIPMEIKVSFEMIELRDFEIKMSRFCITGSMKIEWYDDRLIWTPSSHGNINSTRLPTKKIWTPPIVLKNSFAGVMMLGDTADVTVKNDGTVVWTPMGAFETTCDADVTYFPFDSQTCSIKFAIMGYDMSDMVMAPEDGLLKSEKSLDILNSMWDVKTVSTKVTCAGLEQTYEFDYKFDRRYMFHLVGVVLPMVLISMLGLCTFAIPLDYGGRIEFSTTILLTIAVFVVTVSDLLPESSYPRVALICFLIMAQMMLSVMILISVIIGARIHMRDESVPVSGMWRCLVSKKSSSNKVGSSELIKDFNQEHNEDVDKNVTWKNVGLKYEKWCLLLFIGMTCVVNFSFIPIMGILG